MIRNFRNKDGVRKWMLASCIAALSVILLSVSPFLLNAQSTELAEFTVHSGEFKRVNTPVSASLEGIPLELHSGRLQLFEVVNGEEKPVDSQLDGDYDRTLRWILKGETAPRTERSFVLKSVSGDSQTNGDDNNAIEIEDDGESLTLKIADKNILSYRYAEKPAPKGVSQVFARGGYIHPLWSPAGEVLTRIQPSDHYHHYGIWNPWTKTEFEGKEIDFWNLVKEQGTVRPESVPVKVSGDVYGGFEAILNHVDLKASTPSGEKVALKEKWEIKAWNADPDQKVWLIDFASTLNPASESPLTIKAYRYQGFSIRATEKWDDKNATLLTSEGKNKSNGNGTRARWTDLNGVSDAGKSGILMMTHPGNYNFPEQLRIWPTGANGGRENVFFNFNPAQDRDWELHPGNTYALKYRMMVYDGTIQPEVAERYWQDFSHPPKVEVSSKTSLKGSKVLLYTKNGKGFVHKNIPSSIKAIKELGEKYGFTVDHSEDPSVFTDQNLKQYDALIFSSTNNQTIDTEEQKQAFQRYIRSGGGFVAIHSASGSERDWPWFWKLLGGTFYRHAPFQEFTIDVSDKNHPSTSFLPDTWVRADECYYLKHLNPNINVLLQADMTTVQDGRKNEYPGDVFGDAFPLAWYHEFEGGRSWYTSLGHSPEDYEDPLIRKHILGGIQWAVGAGSVQ